MLQINHLSITMKKDLRTLIDDFSFTLNSEDKAVIIGEEGNGKSTLLKLIYDSQLVDNYVDYSGEIITQGTRLGFLYQELTAEQKEMTIYEYCCKIPDFFDISPKEIAHIAKELSIPSDFCWSEQVIGTLSGGERVKLQMASILLQKPDILLLDEPSNDLDLETLKWMEQYIRSSPVPIIFISHDLALIESTANVIIHLELVRKKNYPRYTIAKMDYKTYAAERWNRLEHQEQIARKERAEMNAKLERLHQIEQKVNNSLQSVPRGDPHAAQLLKKKMKSVKAMEKRFEKEETTMTQLPDVEDSIFLKFSENVSVPNGKQILDIKLPVLTTQGRILSHNVYLNITGPVKICIIGKNGCGKSTLLKLIAQELCSRSDIRCSYMPQNYEECLDFSVTPPEFLAPSLKKEDITRARTYLGSVKYTPEEMSHTCFELSGGQKAKLIFIKMVLDESNVLLLDEPTRNFSPLSTPVICEMLNRFSGTVLCVSHDRSFIRHVFDIVYRLSDSGLEMVYDI